MSRRLIVASLNYSSWSLRAWLALTHAGLDFDLHRVGLYVDPNWKQKVLAFSGAGKVPILVDGSLTVHEALAICEYAAELAPEARLWPEDPALRARARAISSEMATNFSALREEMGMNARARAKNFTPSDRARAEVARVAEIWSASLDSLGGPYLFGHFTIADCMYAPVASRFRSYGIELSGAAANYAENLWQQPIVAQWYEMARTEPAIPDLDAPFA